MNREDVRKAYAMLDTIALDPKVLRATDDLLVALKLDLKLKEVIVERMRVQPLWYLLHKAPIERKLECLDLLMEHFLKHEVYESCAVIYQVTQSVIKHNETWRMLADAYGQDQGNASSDDNDQAA